MSKITVTTIAGQTSGSDANKVKIESGDTLEVVTNATVGGDLTVDTSTLKVDSSNNRVGVGLTAPEQPLHVRSSTFAYVRSESTNSTLTGFDMGQHQDGSGHLNLRDNHPIKISTNDTLRLRVDADGLKFGSDTAAANAMDDYEEGTWTPNFANKNSSATQGKYTKIGNFVTCTFDLQANGTNSAVQITGAPFAMLVGAGQRGGGLATYQNRNSTEVWTVIPISSTDLSLYHGAASRTITGSETVIGTFSFFTTA